eukprot:367986_1
MFVVEKLILSFISNKVNIYVHQINMITKDHRQSISRGLTKRHQTNRDKKNAQKERMRRRMTHCEPTEPQHKKPKILEIPSFSTHLPSFDPLHHDSNHDFVMNNTTWNNTMPRVLSFEPLHHDTDPDFIMNNTIHEEPQLTATSNSILFGNYNAMSLPSLTYNNYTEEHRLCEHHIMDITARDPNELICEKQTLIQRQKNKIMTLAKEIKKLHGIIHDKTKQINQLLTQQKQNNHVKKYIKHCIDNEQNVNFLKLLHNMIGKYLEQFDNWKVMKLSDWTGDSARTKQRHVSEVLDMIVGKAKKFSFIILLDTTNCI